ncbi:branched-chain amino acid ABC transporter permease [Cypionkella psychrotolerans]|uniref:branched-chain amino acid ABC transporter permease n=1 Tax=Cypionkella psychrotolerans TaxID=1678131 RepID=UPI0006B5D39E|nr:branched-chain amino acid ABC transporter permease [Cypionkella psychrotolerans]
MTRRLPLFLTIGIWVLLLLAPLALDDWRISQLAQFLTYGLFALSLAFIWGQAGILCFGQAIFFGIGAYLMALITLGKLPLLGESQWTGIILGAVGGGVGAFGLALFMLGGRGLSGAHLAIVTLCAAVVAEVAAQRWDFIGGFNGLLGVPPLVAPYTRDDMFLSSNETYFLVLAIVMAVYLLLLLISRSSFGTLLAAIRSNENRTRYFGFDVTVAKLFAFSLAGMISGLAGALFTAQFGFVSPPLVGFGLSTEVLIWVAVGGREVLLAAFVGAIFVRWVENLLSDKLGQYWLLAMGLMFIFVVILAPRGLFGRILNLSKSR